MRTILLFYYLIYESFFKIQDKKYPKIHYWKNTFGFNGFVFPLYGIVINESLQCHPKLDNLIDHEYVHWLQFKRYGILPMLILYIYQMIKYGYDKSPLEIEARFNEGEFTKQNYTYCVRNGYANTPHNPEFRRNTFKIYKYGSRNKH